MYKDFINTQIQISSNDLWCLSFSIVASNETNKKKCLDVFDDDMTDNSYVIYQSSDDGIFVLGYIEVDDMSIIGSKYYHAFRLMSLIHNNVDPTDSLRQEKCVHIRKWIFDVNLKDEITLKDIFGLLFSDINAIVWYSSKHREEIIYYPVNRSNYRDAAAHFASNFLVE